MIMNDIKDIFIADLPKRDPKLDELMRISIEENSKQWCQERMCEEEVVRYMLYHQVKPVIRGEVTKGKIKWRGLRIARYYKDNTFLGLTQRGVLIKPDWIAIQSRTELDDLLLFGISRLRERSDIKNRDAKPVEYFSGGLYEQMKKE